MSHQQRRPRLVLIQTKVSKMPQQHDLNQCDHFPMSQLNPWMICLGLKVLLKCDSTEPRSSQNAEAAPSSEEARPGLAPEPLLQDAPIPGDDDKESEQPTIAADNTITQPPMHDVQSLSPNFPGVSFAERRRQQERQETSWLRTPLWPLARDHPDPESPGKPKPARHHESVNIAVELFPNGCDGSTNLLAGWHDYNPKTHEIYLGSTADFGASKMDFWLETMFGQGIALFMLPIFPCQPTSSRPPMA
jgi:hypothetical protein